MNLLGCLTLLICFSAGSSNRLDGMNRNTYTTEGTSYAGWGTYVVQASLDDEQLQEYGPSFEQLSVEVTPETPSRLHVKILPTEQERWEVPENIVSRTDLNAFVSGEPLKYKVQEPSNDKPYALRVIRAADGQAIFDTTGTRIVFKDQYIELTTKIPADASLYGLGEVTLPSGFALPRDGINITLWARDLSCAIEGANLYGAHPFYLQVNADGTSHGVLLLNSNGMDVTLNQDSLTYRAIGGLLDFYFFMGPTPEQVIRQYQEVIGTPNLPPYWSLGLHQSKWGYKTLSVLEEVVANYSAAGLPLEVIYSDIDYMNNRFKNAEFDEFRYPASSMQAFVDKLHMAGQRWVPIIDAGVAIAPGYAAYEEGTRDKVFIRDHGGNTYVGQVWPGAAVYPDYLHSYSVSSWLQQKLQRFYSQAQFDGLWLDMNEASNFCTGMNCGPNESNVSAMQWLNMPVPRDGDMTDLMKMLTTCVMSCETAETDNTLAHPPYAIHNFANVTSRDAPLSQNIISPTALHSNGAREYDTHNLYGTAMARSHFEAVVSLTGKRPFLLSRSTFPGAGRWAAHWTGDNAANWENLFYSIAGILNSNLWGIPMVGADICGFIDATQEGDPWTNPTQLPDAEYEELCNRWASAGAFYPFSRNHMGWPARSHEYYRWPSVTAAAKKAYGLRYQLLTYLYTSLYLAHSRGGTVARPLLFTAPADAAARIANKQWMLGESLLVSPVVTKGTTTIKPYFTAGVWYSAWDYKPLALQQGQTIDQYVPLGDIAVHYRGGTIIPLQQYAPVTPTIRYSPITLVVAVPSSTAGSTASSSKTTPPYALDPECSIVRTANPGSLVSCGVIFMDTEVDGPLQPDSYLEVWYAAITEPDRSLGRIISSVVAPGRALERKLHINAIHVIGMGQDVIIDGRMSLKSSAGSRSDSSKDAESAADTVMIGCSADSSSCVGDNAGSFAGQAAAKPLVATLSSSAQMSHRRRLAGSEQVYVNGQQLPGVSVEFDSAAGVLKVTNLDVNVAENSVIAWRL